MLLYILRRLLNVVVMLLVVATITFGIFFLVPLLQHTDPVMRYIGKNANPVAIAGIKVKLGLDKPVYEQFWLYLKGLVVGRDYANGNDVIHCPAPCFGISTQTQTPVWPTLLHDVTVTGSLAAGAAVLWLVFGVGTGVVSALRKRTAIDRVAMVTALAGVSLPVYFTGLAASALFVYNLGWLQPTNPDVTFTSDPGAWFQGMLLPWITLAFLFAATYARLTRATMLDVLGEDYIRTARAKGLPERTVIGKHAMRSTLTPIMTVFGMDLGGLLGGAILTENVFNLHGLGFDALNGITKNDLPMIMGVTLFAAFFIVMANLIVDLLYAVVDPRVRLA
ncbi:ABC transporter permease [Streptacidiphilus pinicola]|uniref:ABC transporter permease n=1 Tax=Streptacidiphilus pinicola TaxID=2219663 RepID=A0A2X0J3W7_9ACTN|nr:ABC transporter permease [Streptacidiphilus pinicola]RAG82068.1 ABC transporter permease [Streptacidiphilus pinicola]